MKTELTAINSKPNSAEEWISDLEHTVIEITQLEQQIHKKISVKQYMRPKGWYKSKPIYTY